MPLLSQPLESPQHRKSILKKQSASSTQEKVAEARRQVLAGQGPQEARPSYF